MSIETDNDAQEQHESGFDPSKPFSVRPSDNHTSGFDPSKPFKVQTTKPQQDAQPHVSGFDPSKPFEGKASTLTDPETKAAAERSQFHPIEGSEFHAAPSTWEAFKGAVKHPIDYLQEVEADTQEGGGRTLPGRILGHMQHGSLSDTGYTADKSGLAPIMAGPIQGPPKVLRGALRIAAPPDPNKTVEQNIREDVGGLNELSEGAMQTPGAVLGVAEPAALPKLIAGGAVGTQARKGLKAIGLPDEYADLGGNIAGVAGTVSLEHPDMLIRGAAKTADVVAGKPVRSVLKKILPTSMAPAIEENVHVPGRTAGLSPIEKVMPQLEKDVQVAQERLKVAQEKVDISTNARLVVPEEDSQALKTAQKQLQTAQERRAVAKETIPVQKESERLKSESAYRPTETLRNASKEPSEAARQHSTILQPPSEEPARPIGSDKSQIRSTDSKPLIEPIYTDAEGNLRASRRSPDRPFQSQWYPNSAFESVRSASRIYDVPSEVPAEHAEAKPKPQGRAESGTSPPNELIPSQSAKPSPWATDTEREAAQPTSLPRQRVRAGQLIPTEAAPLAPSTEVIPTQTPAAEAKMTPEREPGLLGNDADGREAPRTADDYHPAVRQKVYELSNTDLDKLAKAHGIDPSDPQYARTKEMRNEGRHQTGRQKLADDITAAMSDDEKINLGRNIEQSDSFASKDTTSQSKAEKAAKNFPRLRGPVDEAGNPVGSLSSLSPKELHENLGFGERNKGVTKEEFEAAKKSFNDKATRSNAGVDPTMLAAAAKIAAYYIEGGIRSFAEFSTKMVEQLGEAVRPHLPTLYGDIKARAEAGAPRTWKGTAEGWTESRANVDAAVKRAKNLPEGPRLPEALGGKRTSEEQPFQGKTLDPDDVRFKKVQIERYVDPKGQFYKTVLKELRKTVASDSASDLAQEVMLDYQQGVIDGKFTTPTRPSDEGLVTNQLKAIARNKAADWADKASGTTASGTPRNVIDTKRMSESKSGAGYMKEAHATDHEVGSSEDESVSKGDKNANSPYGFGNEPDYRNEHSNAQRALEEYLKQNPKTAQADRELLRNASERSVAKAEEAYRNAYGKELAKSGDVEKAIEAGRKAAALTNRNKYNATDRYFGLTDADMTKLGQSNGMTGTKFRARLTAIMDDLNRRATQGEERPRTGPAEYTGRNNYTSFLSGEGPARSFSKINVEKAPAVDAPTGTNSLDRSYGNAEGFISAQPKAEGQPPTRSDSGAGQTAPLIPPTEAELTGRSSNIADATRRGQLIPEAPSHTVSPNNLEGAAANRERIANARVAEAEQVLSEATTPAAQRRARAELEDATDRLNYLKALNQPVSGGSQGIDARLSPSKKLSNEATDFLGSLQGKGFDVNPDVEELIPQQESRSIIKGVQQDAAKYNQFLKQHGFEDPIQTGGPTELIPNKTKAVTSEETAALANRAVAEKVTAERPKSEAESDIDALAAVRKRLELKPSYAPSSAAPETLGNQRPVQPSSPDAARLRERANVSAKYETEQGNARRIDEDGNVTKEASSVTNMKTSQCLGDKRGFLNVRR